MVLLVAIVTQSSYKESVSLHLQKFDKNLDNTVLEPLIDKLIDLRTIKIEYP